MHHDAQKVEQLKKMQTFGPVGEPEDQAAQNSGSNLATGQAQHFALRDSADVVKISGTGTSKQITRQAMQSSEAGWTTIQVGNELFQAQDNTKSCRWVNLSGNSREERPMITEHAGFAMCKLNDSHVFIVGGENSKFAERFNVQDKLWEAMPEMNQPRLQPGACTLNGALYVFCGQHGEEVLSSVEKLVNCGGP